MARNILKLKDLFDVVLDAVKNKREDINALDTYNGNHGDNMVQNIRLIKDSIEGSGDVSPAAALLNASQKLLMAGKGGTSQYYADGLKKVADLFVGRDSLDAEDMMTLVETLMGSIPTQGHPGEGEGTPSVLDMVAALSGKEGDEQVYADGMGQIGDLFGMLGGISLDESSDEPGEAAKPVGGVMDMFSGLMGGQQQAEVESQNGFDNNILRRILPTGLAFLRSRREGADTAAQRIDLVRTLLGAEPTQAHSSREGAATVIGKSILEYLLEIR